MRWATRFGEGESGVFGSNAQDHLTGKQYLGWLAIREKLGEMQRADAERGYSKAAEARPAKDARPSERDRDRDRCCLFSLIT